MLFIRFQFAWFHGGVLVFINAASVVLTVITITLLVFCLSLCLLILCGILFCRFTKLHQSRSNVKSEDSDPVYDVINRVEQQSYNEERIDIDVNKAYEHVHACK